VAKKGYTVVKKKMPERPPEMLKKLAPAEQARTGEVSPYDQVAPGLYPDETLVELDTGERVAVSVEPYWLEGGGVSLHGYARWVEDDGSTKISPDGKPVELSISNTFDHGWLEKYSQSQLATEIIRIMLGEDDQIKDVLVVEADKRNLQRAVSNDANNSEWADPEAVEQQMIALSKEVRDNASIRAAIKQVKGMSKVELAL
jgi:hypothetical protein